MTKPWPNEEETLPAGKRNKRAERAALKAELERIFDRVALGVEADATPPFLAPGDEGGEGFGQVLRSPVPPPHDEHIARRSEMSPHDCERWSLDMALAWAVFRTEDAAQDAWSQFRRATGQGVWTLDELPLRLAMETPETPKEKRAGLQEGVWRRLKSALADGRIAAEGSHHPSGEGRTIHRVQWPDLRPQDDEVLGVVYADRFGQSFSGVTIARADVLALWPSRQDPYALPEAYEAGAGGPAAAVNAAQPGKAAVRVMLCRAIALCRENEWPALGAVEAETVLRRAMPGLGRDRAREVRQETEFTGAINGNPGQGKKNKQTRPQQLQALCGFLTSAQSHN